MRSSRILTCLVLVCAVLGAARSWAQSDIPPALEPWRDVDVWEYADE